MPNLEEREKVKLGLSEESFSLNKQDGQLQKKPDLAPEGMTVYQSDHSQESDHPILQATNRQEKLEGIYSWLGEQYRALQKEIAQTEVEQDKGVEYSKIQLDKQEERDLKNSNSAFSWMELPPSQRSFERLIASQKKIKEEYLNKYFEKYKKVENESSASEIASYIYTNFLYKYHKAAIESAVHLKGTFGTTLDKLSIDEQGEVVLGEQANTQVKKITWDKLGRARVDEKKLKVYAIPLIEGNPKEAMLIIKAKGTFAGGTPMIPGGTVDITHIKELKPEYMNINIIALKNEIQEETNYKYEMTELMEKRKKINKEETVIQFYKVNVRMNKTEDRNKSQDYTETQGNFVLNIDHIMKEQGITIHSRISDVKKAIIKRTYDLGMIDSIPRYNDDWRKNTNIRWNDYYNVAFCTQELVGYVREYLQYEQQSRDLENWADHIGQ